MNLHPNATYARVNGRVVAVFVDFLDKHCRYLGPEYGWVTVH